MKNPFAPLPTYSELKSILKFFGIEINKRTRVAIYDTSFFISGKYSISKALYTSRPNNPDALDHIRSVDNRRTMINNFTFFQYVELDRGLVTKISSHYK